MSHKTTLQQQIIVVRVHPGSVLPNTNYESQSLAVVCAGQFNARILVRSFPQSDPGWTRATIICVCKVDATFDSNALSIRLLGLLLLHLPASQSNSSAAGN